MQGKDDSQWNDGKIDIDGFLYNKNYVKDAVSLSWVPAQKNEFNVAGDLIVSAALPTGAAQDGTDITSPTAMPAGGVGIRGWLSAIWTKLNGTITISGAVTGDFYPVTQPVSATALPLPAGAATLAEQSVIESLIDTLQELIQRLAPLGSAINIAGGNGLRVVGVGGTYAVTGPQTSAQYIASNLTQRIAIENLTAQANINNAVGA